jgi:23S rRNA (cytosine1962-C5)-methyltransferase
MINLPEIPTKVISVKLRPKAERMVKKRHPWVFEDSITKQNTEGKSGDVVVIYDTKKNKFLACGLFDPNSPIRIKLLQFGKPAKLDSDFFKNRIDTIFAKRDALLLTDTNSYRFVYGEADGLPGLIADVYADVLVVKIYSAIWFPYLKDILPHLLAKSNCKTIVLRLSRNVQKSKENISLKDGQVIYGDLANNVVVFKEHGVHFSANVIYGHKTGYFLDHRENRKRVGALSKDKTVLDVFSYAGGFSVHALANGAKEVTSLDISAQALEMAVQNGKLNDYNGIHNTMAIDAFIGLHDLIKQGKTFDLVVIDPPSFAKSAKEIDKAKHSYSRLARLGTSLTKKGGLLVLASCSSRVDADTFFDICEAEIQNGSRSFKVIDNTYHDKDHPIINSFPEGAYLKCGYYKLD